MCVCKRAALPSQQHHSNAKKANMKKNIYYNITLLFSILLNYMHTHGKADQTENEQAVATASAATVGAAHIFQKFCEILMKLLYFTITQLTHRNNVERASE